MKGSTGKCRVNGHKMSQTQYFGRLKSKDKMQKFLFEGKVLAKRSLGLSIKRG